MLSGIWNELRLLRADQAALADRELEVNPIQSPAQKRRAEEEWEEKQRIRGGIMAQLHGTT